MSLPDSSEPRFPTDWARTISETADALDALLEICAGHRIKAEAAGFSSETAETMAAALYAHLILSMFS